MSADRLHESLRRLHASADALELGVGLRVSAIPPCQPGSRPTNSPARRRSTARVVAFALAYPAVSLAALTTTLAVGDAALPRPDAPHLAEPAPWAPDSPQSPPAIPPRDANRP